MKKMNKLFIASIVAVLFIGCKETSNDSSKTNEVKVENQKDNNGFNYVSYTNDPTGLRLYTLDNGLKVYLAQNFKEPKIQTFIPVRAGSVYDPSDNTGLAHYLEHMLFKGTSKIGSVDFDKEKVELQKISDLYEKHKAEKDPKKKLEIYKEIDKVSHEASKLAIANEYDNMISGLGAEGTNAWTWHEETVYTNKIPANELDKWLKVESERFSELVLRLFHTELEAVYEEYNISQDSDFRRSSFTLMDALFPNHPYGQQPTIGVSDHLKNPSMEAIHAYFNKYYVPNNMAVILVGDLQFEETIQKVNAAFGGMKSKEVTYPERPQEIAIEKPIIKEVTGPETARTNIAFRSKGIGSKDEKYLTVIDYILSNSTAGLIDLNLNQKQKVQSAGCYTEFMNDYGLHQFYVTPKNNQTLEEATELVLGEIERIKKGEFEDWIIDAVVKNFELNQVRQNLDASSVAYQYVSAFVHFQDWGDKVRFLNELKQIKKEDLVAFANDFYKENYVIVHKRQGKVDNLVKVPKPKITPNKLNREKVSDFVTSVNTMKSEDLSPKYIDYKSEIQKSKISNGLEIEYIKNTDNDLAELDIIFDMGKDHNKKLPIAVGYLEYLGTEKYSPEDLKKEFYKLGINYGVSAGAERSYVYLSGLRENLDKGLALLEDLWNNAKADKETYKKYIDKLAKQRNDNKLSKGQIMWSGLWNYGQYGENSRLRDIYTIEELNSFNPEELVSLVKELKNYKHRVFYYGKDLNQAKSALENNHSIVEKLKDYPEKKSYEYAKTGDNVYFVNYDMVQAEMLFLAKGEEFDPQKMAVSTLFNTYFGSGLSSIVFQEIRESKSLAYSAFSSYSNASEKGKPNYVYAYIGTQANKLPDAVDAMMNLMNNMPEAEKQFNAAKNAALKKIAAQRINDTRIFWTYESLKKRGFTNDNREEVYNAIKNLTMKDLKDFFDNNIKGQDYNIMVLANKKDIDFKSLSKLGKVKELDVDHLFNYEKAKKVKL
ncbi:M16 family metallopeptidase [Tenacibaculum jejuense]|uniref:Probable lipoprotein. Peptidase, M16 family protein n=1 Tax=Tenacibaculum jejuense TaxID=584609 RepID=A0A238UBD0_9FLAO|nr:Probable lipoprotein precursor. Peptidase, M16 family protein [Tenacibaculum jejuense]